MPIQSIISQPAANALFAAYRPIIILVQAQETGGDAKPPVVYCDIYFGGVYYKTQSKTQYKNLHQLNSDWEFDIQDAAQEYLKKQLAPNGGNQIIVASTVLTMVKCKFRSSGFDSNGFITSEDIPPVQGTGSTDPEDGTGTDSNTFYIVNAALQHDDNQDIAAHLSSYRKTPWAANAFPLTHRPAKYFLSTGDSDYFPAVIDSSYCIAYMKLNYRLRGQSTVRAKIINFPNPCNASVQAISTFQIGGTTNVRVSWITASEVLFKYRVDGGAWIVTAERQVLISSLTTGDHLIEIVPLCQCAEGATFSKTFPVSDPIVFACDSTVSNIVFNQTNVGAGSVTFTPSGPADRWLYYIDNVVIGTANVPSFNLSGLVTGTRTLKIVPRCSNLVLGTEASVSIVVQAIPSLTKIAETNTGPGGIRTQTFKVGPSVSAGNRFVLTVYSHDVTVTAIAGDTPQGIAIKLRNAVNNTTGTQWDDHLSAPSPGTNGYEPDATSSGDTVIVTLNWGNSFSYNAYIS